VLGDNKHYVLTATAERDFRQARQWSLSRWGAELTKKYFVSLHESAEYIAQNHHSLEDKEYLTGTTGLGIHAVKEHYLVYVPIREGYIGIVALIRQTRDIPAILKANNYLIRREISDICNQFSKK
jgi:plasmid stabilization system protein ParE